MHFGHVLTAMVTPFNEHGDVDFEAMTKLIEYLLANGTEGLVVTGTTGESATLTVEEMEAIYRHVVQIVQKRVPVIAGTGTNDTRLSITLSELAKNCGADGLMLVAPYYNRPNQAGLYEHFKTIATTTTLPIMLYNIPTRTGVTIETETIIQLSKLDNIVALKDASGNLEETAKVIEHSSFPFYVYSGDDSMTLPILSIGGVGVVSVASHVIGKQMNELITAFQDKDFERAQRMHRRLLPLMEGLFIAPSPAPVKEALRIRGVDVGDVRLPLVPLNETEKRHVASVLKRCVT
ncbi:MAG TPA: 4-hydroxy-tetrahydrodipicolinate synthase [Pseudogracilibacillus sp.]|nr:4-hydroxy-tetrahydrodipicolinate synthase [Pseudogracilibacillus sp.]